MKSHPAFSTTAKLLAASMLLLVLGACTIKPRPPVFSLYGYKCLVMAPLENLSVDPAMSQNFQSEVTRLVVRLGACPVIEADQVAPFLSNQPGETPVAADPVLLKKLGARFKSDVVMTGAVESYQEIQDIGEPRRSVTNTKTGAAEWGFYINRKVVVAVSAKLLDPASGGTLWTQRATGTAYFNKWNVLPIPGDVVAPQSYILKNAMKLAMHEINRAFNNRDDHRGTKLRYMSNDTFADLRQRAIANAAGYLTGDFRGRGNWTPNMQAP